MGSGKHVITVGGLVVRGSEVLLVRHTYGPTAYLWDFPRGHLELDESIDAAAEREVLEEASVSARSTRLIAVRNQVVGRHDGQLRNDVLMVWLMD